MQAPDRLALLLFISFTLLYLSTAKGVLEYGDDIAMLEVTKSIIERWDVDVPAKTPGADQARPTWPTEKHYSKYGLGQSVLAIPFYVAGRAVEPSMNLPAMKDRNGFARTGAPILAVTLLNILSSAATVALLYVTCQALAFSPAASLAAAVSLGAGTFLWHYSRTFMSEPTTALACLMTFYLLIRFSRSGHLRWLIGSGAAAGIALLLKLSNVVLLLPLSLWLFYVLWSCQRRAWLSALQGLTAWSLPILSGVVIVAAHNFLRFGRIEEAGYGEEAVAFWTPLHTGIVGLLFSPGKSVFLYAPALVPGAIGLASLWRQQRVLAAVLTSMSVGLVVYYARFHLWYGGGVWGPRFLLPVLPFMLIGLAALIDRRLSRTGTILVGLVGAASLLVQVVSVLVPYVPYQLKMDQSSKGLARLLWDPAASPILAHTESLLRREYPLELAARYYPMPLLPVLQAGAADRQHSPPHHSVSGLRAVLTALASQRAARALEETGTIVPVSDDELVGQSRSYSPRGE